MILSFADKDWAAKKEYITKQCVHLFSGGTLTHTYLTSGFIVFWSPSVTGEEDKAQVWREVWEAAYTNMNKPVQGTSWWSGRILKGYENSDPDHLILIHSIAYSEEGS